MNLFATAAHLAELQKELEPSRPTARLLELAWYLRQTNSDDFHALLGELSHRRDLDERQRRRLDLVRNELLWLSGKAQEAYLATQSLAEEFLAVQDWEGCADASLLLTLSGTTAGRGGQRQHHLLEALSYAERLGDADRILTVRCFLIQDEGFLDAQATHERWTPFFDEAELTATPWTLARIATARAALDFGLGQFGLAVARYLQGLEGMEDTQQLANAVLCAANIAESFNVLNDPSASLEWAQRSLELARRAGWPMPLGHALSRVAENFRKAGRPDQAGSLLALARDLYKPFYGSRQHALLLAELGEYALAIGDAETAVSEFDLLASLANEPSRGLASLQGMAAEGKAKGLVRLGRYDDAEREIEAGLKMERAVGRGIREISFSQLGAQIRRLRGRPDEAVALLEHALAYGEAIAGYTPTMALLTDLAEAYAATGRFEDAYRASTQAQAAGQAATRRAAENQATALQIRLSIEQTRAEADRERQRADLLQKNASTLEVLGLIGQEITANLDPAGVYEVLHRHVQTLLLADCFTLWLVDDDRRGLTTAFDVEAGVWLPGMRISLDDDASYAVRCARGREEVLVDVAEQPDANQVPGTLETHSALFLPLLVGDRLLGVMSVQALQRGAYGEQERFAFRTLCAYTAIGLDNALAYTWLKEAQDRLVAQEKLAALGSLVAGVAHELGTPIGNGLLGSTHLQDLVGRLPEFPGREALTSELRQSADLVVRSLQWSAKLVQSFKHVAIDRTSEQRRRFDLGEVTEEIMTTLAGSIEAGGHRLVLQLPRGLEVDSYPGPYGRLLSQFVSNALLHGFGKERGGELRLSVVPIPPGQVELTFSDNGAGVAPEDLSRIFDPFFTSRLGQGTNGLGLSVSHNIATVLFGGRLTVASAPGRGTTFVWTFPLQAPSETR